MAFADFIDFTLNGFRAGFGHKVNKNLSINVFGGLESNDSPSGFTGDPNRTLWSIHGNVFYRPFPELAPNLWLALEYIHGDRHKVNKNLSFNVFGGLERNDSPGGFTATV